MEKLFEYDQDLHLLYVDLSTKSVLVYIGNLYAGSRGPTKVWWTGVTEGMEGAPMENVLNCDAK